MRHMKRSLVMLLVLALICTVLSMSVAADEPPANSFDPATGTAVVHNPNGSLYSALNALMPASYTVANDVKILIVTGNLAEIDFSNMSYWLKSTSIIDMSEATIAAGALKQVYSGTGRYFLQYAEHIIMPKNGEYTLPSNLFYYSSTINKSLKSVDLTGFSGDELNSAFMRLPNLETVILPDSPIRLGDNAFNSCPKLKNIDLSQVTYLGTQAFKDCKALEAVDLSSLESWKTGGSSFFSGCTALESVILPTAQGTTTTIPSNAFYGCTSLTDINLDHIKTIESYTFTDCSSLKKADLSSVTYISVSAFRGCSSLSELRFGAMTAPIVPDTSIYPTSNAFSGVPASGTLYYPEGATGYDKGTFGAPSLNGWLFIEDVVEPETYTVTFDSNGGTVVEPVVVNSGEKIAKPDDPTRENYTFLGWYLGDEAFDFNALITADITLIAEWQKDPEKITLKSATPSAWVDKLNGNQNRLNITVMEKYSDGSIKTITWSGLINNNAAGTYDVGGYKVYVNTKGNTDIRECYIVQ